ncbi:MAG TPA: TolC family protein [Fibrobacteria bacterium]|nr:TolC family protein [Fibrobacteria bacterium]
MTYLISYSCWIPVAAACLCAQATFAKPMTLDSVRQQALAGNHFLKAARLKMDESAAKLERSRVEFLPIVSISAMYAHFWEVPVITASAGAFGAIPLGGQSVPMPPDNQELFRGDKNLLSADVLAYQPITQLWKIFTGVEASKAEAGLAAIQAESARREILLGVESAWFGLRVSDWDRRKAEARVAMARQSLQDAESALGAGKLIDAGRAGLAAALADEERKLLEAESNSQNLQAELRALLGMDSAEAIEADTAALAELPDPPPLEDCIRTALDGHDGLRQARLQEDQARLALKAAKQTYIPDVGLVGGMSWQNNGSTYFPEFDPFVGVMASWNLRGLYANRYESEAKAYLSRQASENRLGNQQKVRVEVEKAWRKLSNAKSQLQVARKARDYRLEDRRDQARRLQAGLIVKSAWLECEAQWAEAESNLAGAEALVHLSATELFNTMGKGP